MSRPSTSLILRSGREYHRRLDEPARDGETPAVPRQIEIENAQVSKDRVPSALATAKVSDLAVETLAVWSALHRGAPSRGVKQATEEMVYCFLAPPDESE